MYANWMGATSALMTDVDDEICWWRFCEFSVEHQHSKLSEKSSRKFFARDLYLIMVMAGSDVQLWVCHGYSLVAISFASKIGEFSVIRSIE